MAVLGFSFISIICVIAWGEVYEENGLCCFKKPISNDSHDEELTNGINEKQLNVSDV